MRIPLLQYSTVFLARCHCQLVIYQTVHLTVHYSVFCTSAALTNQSHLHLSVRATGCPEELRPTA
jgi:hypothetical protein